MSRGMLTGLSTIYRYCPDDVVVDLRLIVLDGCAGLFFRWENAVGDKAVGSLFSAGTAF